MIEPSQTTIEVWVRLVRAHAIALSSVEKALKNAGLPPLSWYDALLELERFGDTGTRPVDLEQNLLLPQYGLSRLLSRLVDAGYVERRPHQEDGRGQIVAITDAGREVRARSWPIYAAAIQSSVGETLEQAEAESLSAALHKIISRSQEEPAR